MQPYVLDFNTSDNSELFMSVRERVLLAIPIT